MTVGVKFGARLRSNGFTVEIGAPVVIGTGDPVVEIGLPVGCAVPGNAMVSGGDRGRELGSGKRPCVGSASKPWFAIPAVPSRGPN